MARRWANDEIRVKERSKRSFYLSANRSALFNQVASRRWPTACSVPCWKVTPCS